jgi:hypothetical protein
MDQMHKNNQYHKACIVITGDLDDWKYVFRELKMRVIHKNYKKKLSKTKSIKITACLFVKVTTQAHGNRKREARCAQPQTV